jgi:hypothetical protein
VLALKSNNGEERLELEEPVRIIGGVQAWMPQLDSTMRDSVKAAAVKAFGTLSYETNPISWIDAHTC